MSASIEATHPPARPGAGPPHIPGYRLEKLVGKGGMGEVHRAVQLSLGRVVAVKILSGELAADPTFVARFDKEAAALATLSHPNVVSIVDKGKAENTYYLVMEYVDGPSLREVMRSPVFDIPGALRIIMEIARAIDYAHSRGVVHRDLKPENILFDEQAGGIAKVTDFGLATFFDDSKLTSRFNVTETHVSMGTLSYMAPEQRVDAKNADHRADVYSLGVMLYELLVGEVPIGTFDPPSQRRPGTDRRLDGIVLRCLKPSPADRYQRVADLMLDLEPFAPVSFSQVPRKISRVEQLKNQVRSVLRKALRVAEVAVVVAAFAILGVSWARSRYHPPPRPSPGTALTAPELRLETATTSPGRIADTSTVRRMVLGEGPDAIPLIAWGRIPGLEGRTVRFPASDDVSVGRLNLDLVDRDGISAQLIADVTATAPPSSFWGGIREQLLGVTREPQSALLLLGSPGRYVAVIVSGAGEPVAFEWALGERRGTMLGPPSPTGGAAHVKLEVDRAGQLQAFVGTDIDQRPVGEPLYLGTEWRNSFGAPPTPALGCIDGECTFRQVGYEIGREPPDLPEPLVLTEPSTAAKSKTVAKGTTKRKTTSDKKLQPLRSPAPTTRHAKK
ncbi:MAG TPA: serine/threonine-protein kinase [Myxococcaceae bacterium]|nr:serine/threonine-protein kinase [Myxococcaceae bacterium]